MPSLFTSTYPLDHGGYNDGILNRPKSYVELLQKNGYQTYLASSCNILSSISGYQRGFEEIYAAIDYRHILDYRIDKTHSYHLSRVKNGEISALEACDIILPPFDRELAGLREEIFTGSEKNVWGKKLRKYNEWIAERIPDERRLIKDDPRTVLGKLLKIPPVMYWRWLGEKEATSFDLFRYRVAESIRWRWKNFAVNREIPFFWVSHQQVRAEEIVDGLIDLLPTLDSPWYAHMHLMDVHDFQIQSDLATLIRKFIQVPRCLKARRAGGRKLHLLYELALCCVDDQLGRLFEALDRAGQRDSTAIAIIADHGSYYAGSPRHRRNVALRTNFEDLEFPLVISCAGEFSSPSGQIDTMGIAPTLLDICEVRQHESFKGVSLGNGGRNAVISESAGGGNADILRRDLYFTITTAQYRLMSVLRDKTLEVFCLYDRNADPQELENLANQPEKRGVISDCIRALVCERQEILTLRGIAGDALIDGWTLSSHDEIERRL